MNGELFSLTLWDGFCAAMAAAGFSILANPPKRVILFSALLAALAHSVRFYFIHVGVLDIAMASFAVAFLTGLLCVFIAKTVKCPAECFAFPSLLPMIPGLYAYKTILGLMKFMQNCDDPNLSQQLIIGIFKNGLTTFFVMLALVVGIAIPLLIFKKQNYTRPKRKKTA